MKVLTYIIILASIVSCIAGCITPASVNTVYKPDRVDAETLAEEGTIVFVRPKDYNIFGTESLRDYVEIVYEKAERNNAGLLKLNLGIRNRGGQWFYDHKGHDFQLSIKTAFYNTPLASGTPQAAPIYETNWQTVKLLLGATEHYSVTCPVSSATYYQVTISDLFK